MPKKSDLTITVPLAKCIFCHHTAHPGVICHEFDRFGRCGCDHSCTRAMPSPKQLREALERAREQVQ